MICWRVITGNSYSFSRGNCRFSQSLPRIGDMPKTGGESSTVRDPYGNRRRAPVLLYSTRRHLSESLLFDINYVVIQALKQHDLPLGPALESGELFQMPTAQAATNALLLRRMNSVKSRDLRPRACHTSVTPRRCHCSGVGFV